jgi:hypothetical protein
LWFIQTTQEEVDPLMAFDDFCVKTALTSFTFTLVYDWLTTHSPSIAHAREVIYLLTLSADEIYATYAKGWQPEEILGMDHTEIATRLMVERGLTQDAADFAADQILLVAERNSDREA